MYDSAYAVWTSEYCYLFDTQRAAVESALEILEYAGFDGERGQDRSNLREWDPSKTRRLAFIIGDNDGSDVTLNIALLDIEGQRLQRMLP